MLTNPKPFSELVILIHGGMVMLNLVCSVGSVQDLPGATTLTMADDDNHSRQRRTLSHAFSQKALLEQESIIRGYVDLFVEKMKPFAASGDAVNMCDWFSETP